MRTYQYFVNPFLVIGSRSFKKAVKMSKKTYNELQARQADPFYGAQFAIYEPIHLALMAAYNAWKAAGGLQKGATLSFQQMLKLLPKKMDGFASLIKATSPPNFEIGSPNYVAIFPNDMKNFQANKSIEVRMTEVSQVATVLATFSALSAISTSFTTYMGTLLIAQGVQQSKVGTKGSDVDVVAAEVETAMVALYAFMGNCIAKFPGDATVVEPVFDMRTLRNHRQLKFTGTLAGGEIHNIMQHTFHDFDSIELTAKDTKQQFYLALNATDGPGTYTLITVNANTSVLIDAIDFTGLATNHYLCVVNTETTTGKFEVQL